MKTRNLSLATIALLSIVSTVVAQPGFCPLPPLDDGFNVGCCNATSPLLPSLPALSISSAWGVYNGCNNAYSSTAVVNLGAPIWVLCDYAVIPIQIQLAGMMFTGGNLLGKYARTWIEPDPLGLPRQVWRILLNGDIPFWPSPGCPAPLCAPAVAAAPYFMPVHLVGHIDYACDTSGLGGYVAAFSLSHLPGCFQHASFSTNSIPALATSAYSYHLVGPAPFLFTNTAPEPQGILVGDSVRSSTLFWSPFFYQCEGESEVIPGGTLTTASSDCFCASAATGAWKHQNLSGSSCCFGFTQGFQSIPIPGTPLAPTGLASFNIGKWPGTTSFPGNRTLHLYVGVLTHYFTCSPVLQPLKIVTGIGTTDLGFGGMTFPSSAATPCSPPILVMSHSFIDLQNMLPLAYVPTFGAVGLGSLFVSDWVLSLNTL